MNPSIRKVLAVDNEPHILKLIERIVTEKTSYELTTTGNPLEARQIIQSRLFDVIISDIRMPGLDGMELVKEIRAAGGGEEVILITAFGSLESAMQAMEQGVSEYLVKPFKRDQFLTALERAMRRRIKHLLYRRLAPLLELAPWETAEQEFKREYIRRALERFSGDINKAATWGGISVEEIINLINDTDRQR